jgi:hypothetical protein
VRAAGGVRRLSARGESLVGAVGSAAGRLGSKVLAGVAVLCAPLAFAPISPLRFLLAGVVLACRQSSGAGVVAFWLVRRRVRPPPA